MDDWILLLAFIISITLFTLIWLIKRHYTLVGECTIIRAWVKFLQERDELYTHAKKSIEERNNLMERSVHFIDHTDTVLLPHNNGQHTVEELLQQNLTPKDIIKIAITTIFTTQEKLPLKPKP